MIWQEIFINRKLSLVAIKAGLSSIFNLDNKIIEIVSRIEDLPCLSEEHPVSVVKEDFETGDFVQMLSIYIFIPPSQSTNEIVYKLCKLWTCRCLVSNDSIDSCSWTLFSETKEVPVNLNFDMFEQGIYILNEGRDLLA